MEVCCRSIWGNHFPKTEQFFLTSYLAAGLEAEKTSVDVRLVSNQSPGIAAGLEAFIRRRLGCTVRRFSHGAGLRLRGRGGERGGVGADPHH